MLLLPLLAVCCFSEDQDTGKHCLCTLPAACNTRKILIVFLFRIMFANNNYTNVQMKL